MNPRIPLYTPIYPCIPLYTHVYLCITLYTTIYPCIPLYTLVWPQMSIAGKKKNSMLIFVGRRGIEEPEHLRMRWRKVWTREENAVPPDTGAGASYQTSHSAISARAIAFGRSWPFAAFCYRPCLPVRHWGRDMSTPKPYVTNPTPIHSSKPPLSI